MRTRPTPSHTAVAVLMGLLVGGCTGTVEPQPGPSPTRWGPSLTYKEAYERIPLDGDPVSPLRWEQSALDDLDLQTRTALRVARLLRSLDHHTSSQDYTDAYLYQWVATDRRLEVMFPDGPPGSDGFGFPPSLGPTWIKVVGVERVSPHRVEVHVCEDRGWRAAQDSSEERPSPNRAFLWHFEVIEQVGIDGVERWLVDDVWPDLDLLGPEARRECEEWAVHDPEEDR